MEIVCPHCGESTGYELAESYKGDVSCVRCPKSFYVEIEKGEVKVVEPEPKRKWPKSVSAGKEIW